MNNKSFFGRFISVRKYSNLQAEWHGFVVWSIKSTTYITMIGNLVTCPDFVSLAEPLNAHTYFNSVFCHVTFHSF